MGRTIITRVDESLNGVLARIQSEVITHMKKKYNINEIIIPATLASQILAAKIKGKKELQFSIKKSGLNKGFLQLL